MIAKIKIFKSNTYFTRAKRRVEKNERSSSKDKFTLIILGILFFAIIGFLAVSNFRINKKKIELQSQADSLKKEIQILEEKREQLRAGILEGESESYLEKEARDRLGLKKPGEEVVAVLPPKETQGTSTQENKTFWQKILKILHLRD